MQRHGRTGPAGVVAVLALTIASCSSGGGSPAPDRTSPSGPAHSAAEPAVSPIPTATPAGVVRAIGAAPEGVVYDARTKLVAVAVREPDRLQLVDGRTMTLRTSVALPGHARHLQLGVRDASVLVPVEDADALLQVTLPTGVIAQRTAVGKSPHDAAQAADGAIVTGDEFGQSLSVIRDGAVERTIGQVTQPGGVVEVGPTTVVVDVQAYTVSTFDLDTGARTALVDAGAGPTHGVSAASNQVIVTDTRGNAVLMFTAAPLAALSRLALPGSPYGIAADPSTHTVWVTLTARNEVVGVNVSSGTPRVIARYPTVQQPDTVAVDPGSHNLWITGTVQGQLQHIIR